MNDLLFSFNTVFPLLVMMAAGYIARRLKWLDASATQKANNCVYHLFLPLLLCFNIMDTSKQVTIDGATLLYGFVTTLFTFLFLLWLVPRLCKQRNACGVIIQCVARSNYAIYGIPLVLMMYPDSDTSIAAMMVIVAVPVFNVMSTIALMTFGSEKTDARSLIKGIVLNPLIIMTLLGFALWQLDVQLPAILDNPLRRLGGIATPLALFLLGASLDLGKAKANLKLLTLSVLGRLVFVPLVFLTLAVALGMRDVSLATLIALYASPTAVSSYPMAQQMGGDDDLAAGQVVFTTIFSIITVFFWVFILKSLGFLG